jgi:hypothetical protein
MSEVGVPSNESPPIVCLPGMICIPDDPDDDGGQQCCSEDEEGGSGCPPEQSSSSFSAFPIRYSNGEVRILARDLAFEAFGQEWGHTRSYSNQLTVQDRGINGNSWFIKECPQVGQDANGNLVVIGVFPTPCGLGILRGLQFVMKECSSYKTRWNTIPAPRSLFIPINLGG